MFYRVHATIAFTIDDEAKDFYHDCTLALAKGVTINPDDPNAEASAILLEECYHNEHPGKPCVTIAEDTL